MNISLTITTLVGLLSVSTAFSAYKNIPEGDLEKFKSGAIQAGKESNLSECYTAAGMLTRYRYIVDYIQNSESGKVEQDGHQPILIFNREFSENPKSKYTVIVTSNSNFKSVTAVKLEELTLSQVNKGDLLNPEFSEEYVVTASLECRQPQSKN